MSEKKLFQFCQVDLLEGHLFRRGRRLHCQEASGLERGLVGRVWGVDRAQLHSNAGKEYRDAACLNLPQLTPSIFTL